MGRAKLKMQMIEKEKSRLLTLRKRREGLKKKLHQLTTLCDVPACMIIHVPATNSSSIWPEDSAQVGRLIDSYKADPSGVKAYGLSDFFSGRQKNAEEELVKLRKKNAETKYRTWDDRLDLMDESQLRELSAALRGKAQAVRSRIEFLKREAMMKEKKNVMMFDLGEFDDIDQDDIFSAADAMAAMSTNAQLPVPDYYPLHLPQPLKREAMMKKNNNNAMFDLDESANIDQDGMFSIADVMAAMSANAQLPVPDYYCPPPLNLPALPQPLKREAMVKKNNNNVMLDLDEFANIHQDGMFSIADVMAAMNANAQLPVPDYYCPPPLNLPPLPQPLKPEAMMKKKKNNNVMLDWDESEDIDQGDIFSIADVMAAMSTNAQLLVPDYDPLHLPALPQPLKWEEMTKKKNNVMLDLDEFEDNGQDDSFSIADVMAAMSSNAQLPVPDYYCPPPLNLTALPQPFMDHNYLWH